MQKRNVFLVIPLKGCREPPDDCASWCRKQRSVNGVKVHTVKNGLIRFQQNIIMLENGKWSILQVLAAGKTVLLW